MSHNESQSAPQIDLEKIKGEIGALSDEALKEALFKLRVREKKQQKKSYGSPNAKVWQARQREKRKLMIALAREKGLMNDIDKEADEKAEEELAAERVGQEATQED